jgi:hypothetical protein
VGLYWVKDEERRVKIMKNYGLIRIIDGKEFFLIKSSNKEELEMCKSKDSEPETLKIVSL